MLRQQILTVFHNHHTAGIQLQATLKVLGIEIIGGLGGDIQQGLKGHLTLGTEMDDPQGLVEVVELIPVEGVVFLFGHVLLVLLPQGYHGVQGLHLGIGFVLRLVLRGILLLPGLLHLHADGVADVVGILGDEVTDFVLFQILAVGILLGIGFQHHDHIGTGGIPLGLLHAVAIGAVGHPLVGLVRAVLLGDHGDFRGHHKGGVEAHAKLADDVNVLFLLHGLLEAQRAGLGNGTQVFFHFFQAHADAVIGHGKGAVFLVPGDGNGKLIPGNAHLFIGQGGIGQLVDGIGGIGDDFPQENLPVGINGVDHQIQQPLGLRFELFLFHKT